MINTQCHGCKTPMSFEAVPVKLTEVTGVTRTFWGKDSAPWICSSCRTDERKLKAARLAIGLPAEAEISHYEEWSADAPSGVIA